MILWFQGPSLINFEKKIPRRFFTHRVQCGLRSGGGARRYIRRYLAMPPSLQVHQHLHSSQEFNDTYIIFFLAVCHFSNMYSLTLTQDAPLKCGELAKFEYYLLYPRNRTYFVVNFRRWQRLTGNWPPNLHFNGPTEQIE